MIESRKGYDYVRSALLGNFHWSSMCNHHIQSKTEKRDIEHTRFLYVSVCVIDVYIEKWIMTMMPMI